MTLPGPARAEPGRFTTGATCHNAEVQTTKLESVEGFLIIDVPEADVSVGPVRLGTKLIPSNATNYARELTYGLALAGTRHGGMTLGLKVDPDRRDEAVAAAAGELSERLGSGALAVDPGLRMPRSALGPLAANDPRNPVLRTLVDGTDLETVLVADGAAAAASAVLADRGGLAGARVAVEGLDHTGVAVAEAVEAAGATIVKVSTARGCVTGSFSAADLAAAVAAHGADAPTVLGEVAKPWMIWGGDGVDAIMCGSAPGALTPAGAPFVGATPVVCTGVAPVATKALAMLHAAGAPVVPAFLTAAGALRVAFDGEVTDPATARARARATVEELMAATSASEPRYVAACRRAEDHLRSWASAVPFGRPMA